MRWHTKNRVLAFLLVFVFAFGLAACNDNNATEATTPAVTTTDPVDVAETDAVDAEIVDVDAVDAVDATADSVGDAADATADTVGDAVDTTVDATTDAVDNAADATTDTVNDSLDGTTDTVADVADATAETTDEAVENVTDATTDAVDITTQPLDGAADATTGAVADVNAEVDSVRSQVVSDMEGLDLTNEDETNVLTVRSALTDARDNLATAYANGDEAAQAQWEELQPRFDEAEAALQDNAAEGLQQVQALLEQLQEAIAQ